jgi:hypothetical protein
MAVSALQRLCYHWINPLLTLPVRKMTTPSRRPIANGLARRGLDNPRHVGLTCFTRASNQLAPAVVSACTYIIQDGAVEPENIVRDVTTSFSRNHAAVPFTSSSVRR